MIEPFIRYVEMDPHTKINSVTKEQRRKILNALKGFSIPLSGFRPIEEAIITSGGVDVRDISPKDIL